MTELLIAIALVLVLEGLLPFLSPGGFRGMMLRVGQLTDRQLRIGGLVSMAIGVVLLYMIR